MLEPAGRGAGFKVAMVVVLVAAIIGGVGGVLYAIRSGVVEAPAKLDGGAPRVVVADMAQGPQALFEERVLSEGPYALRIGFTAPPREVK